ncbi:hypothetical protein Tco_0403795 [Tanacetum coccineum]
MLSLPIMGRYNHLMPLSVWKKLSLPELTPTRMTLELVNRSVSYPVGVAEDVFVKYAQEVLGFSDSYGNPTPSLDPILSTSSPSPTPFEEGDFILEEIKACLTNDSIPPGIDDDDFDMEGDLLLLEKLLNDDPSSPLPPKELHVEELKIVKSSIDDPPELELKDLPSHLEYAFLEGTDKLPVIIAKNLKEDEKVRLLKVLKSHKRAIAWKISDIKGTDLNFTRKTKKRPPSLALMVHLPTDACLSAYVMLWAHSKGVIHYTAWRYNYHRGLPSKVNKARAVMSSASSDVTYTSIYTDSEPGRTFWGADDEDVPEGEAYRPEYIPLEDEHEFPAEEQPLPPVDSPTTESPRYVTKSDPEEDPEEYEDDETEDSPVDYPMDGGDDGDDDDGDSPRDDDKEDEDDEEEEEEEEHLAPADSAIVVLVDEPVFPSEGTEPTSISLPPEAEVERLLAMTTPSPSPPISLSPPSAGERLARISSTQALIDAVTAALPSPPLPPLPPSLYIPPPVDHRDEIPESEQPPRKRLGLSTLGSRYKVGESSTTRPTRGRVIDCGFVSMVDAEERRQRIRYVRYSIRDTWVDLVEALPEIAPVTLGEVNTRVTELAELHELDTQDLYALLEDAQDSRSRMLQRVNMDSQRVDLLMGDRWSPGDNMDGGGGYLCFPRGLGSLDRIESGDSSGALDPS